MKKRFKIYLCFMVMLAFLFSLFGITTSVYAVDDQTLVGLVASFPSEYLSSAPENARTEGLMSDYLDSLLDWDAILLDEYDLLPGDSTKGYYGDGGSGEGTIRPICYAILVNAFLSELDPTFTTISSVLQAEMKDHAIKTLRYLTEAHITGDSTCYNGYKWGNTWQSSMWTRAAALGGWIIWDDLDTDLKIGVARVLEYEADRFINSSPKSQEYDDTGAEENAWNSFSPALAANMMPNHPNSDDWDEAAKKYMYNSFSVKADQEDTTTGDDGIMIKDWVTTVNVHPDYTLENHGRVHIGYLKNTLCMLTENSIAYALTGNDLPGAMFHHQPEVFDILKKLMTQDAAAAYVGGTDWRTIHCQASDMVSYSVINVANDDVAAAYLEDVAIGYMRDIQLDNDGYYNFRRDLEWSGLAATRMICSYLMHAIEGEGATPLTESAYDSANEGVVYLPYGKAVIHRTPTKFTSFTWDEDFMGLSLSENGSWQNWPKESSYVGYINGMEAGDDDINIESVKPVVGEDNFSVTGRFKRLDDTLVQDVFFASLDSDITIYLERLTKESGTITSRQTGTVGSDFELGASTRTLYTDDGSTTVYKSTDTGNINMTTNWLNIGDKVGYVVCRDGETNSMQYNYQVDQTRDCDFIHLINETNPAWTEDWACIVTFTNQTSTQTSAAAGTVSFDVDGNTATCTIGAEEITVDFGDLEDSIVIDNSGAGYSVSGSWSTSEWGSQKYSSDYQHDGSSGADASTEWAKWTPTIIDAGDYDIYIWYTENYNRPDAAPLEIVYNGGTDTGKTLNQQINGGQWVLLGTYNLSAGTGNYVKIIASDAGYTTADAVKFVKTPLIIQNGDSGYSESGAWITSAWGTEMYGSDYRNDGTSGADLSSKWAKWTPTIIDAGDYDIYIWYTAHDNRPDAAPLEIVYNGGTDTGKTLNQQTNGGQWVLLGTYNLSAGTSNYVKIIASDAGYTTADAVKFVKKPIIIDDDDNGYTESGTWTTSDWGTQKYGSDYRHDGSSGADAGTEWAKWTPYIGTEGVYDIYIWYTESINRPDAAPLEIKYQAGTDIYKTLSQQVKGGEWVLIGTYNLSAGTDNYVKIIATDEGYTTADAVKFVRRQ